MSEPKKTGVGAYLIAIVGAFLIMFVLVRAMQRFTAPPPVNQARAEQRREKLAEIRAASAKALSSYAWQDQGKGIVRLPIDRAMELTVREAQNPTEARAKILGRLEKATFVPPPPPEAPSEYE